MDDAVAVLQAVTVLHSASAEDAARHSAEEWLQTWRSSPGSWKTCLLLLQTDLSLQEEDRLFLASCLHTAAQQSTGDIMGPLFFGQLLDQVAVVLLASISAGSDTVSRELAGALAALAIRSPSWETARIIPDIVSLIQRQPGLSGWQHQQQAFCTGFGPLMAILLVLQSLAWEVRHKQCTCHPSRRSAVIASISTSPEPMLLTLQALTLQGPGAAPASAQAVCLIEEWCHLGVAPLGLDSQDDTLSALCQRCLVPETCSASADCLAALFNLCAPKPSKSQPSSSAAASRRSPSPHTDPTCIAPSNTKLLHALLQHWKATGYPLSNASGSRGMGWQIPDQAMELPNFDHWSRHVMLAACKVMSAASSALLRPALASATSPQPPGAHGASSPRSAAGGMGDQAALMRYQHEFMLVAKQLLLHLRYCSDEVALVAADFFSGTYLPVLKSIPTSSYGYHALMAQHTPLVHCLTESLVLRTQLKPEVAAVATADARDLPEDARTVRRELAGMLRDISSLVGHKAMLQYMATLVYQGYEQLETGLPASNCYRADRLGGYGPSQQGPSWIWLCCALYAANVVTGRWLSEVYSAQGSKHGRGSMSGAESDDAHCSEDEASSSNRVGAAERSRGGAAAPCRGSSRNVAADHVAGPMGARGFDPTSVPGGCAEADAAVHQLVEIAAISVVHPNSSSKLSGTALTLLGGLAPWYMSHADHDIHPPPVNSRLDKYDLAQAADGFSRSHSAIMAEKQRPYAAVNQLYSRSQSSPLNSQNSVSRCEGAAPASPLPAVLRAVLHCLRSDDAKLSRNGATTLQRLCAHEGMACHLLACHRSWVDMLLAVYQERGGMKQKAGPHEDSSTEELLLRTLCRLACLSADCVTAKSLLMPLVSPQITKLRSTLAAMSAMGNQLARPSLCPTALELVTDSSRVLDVLTAVMESCKVTGGPCTGSSACTACEGGTTCAHEHVLDLTGAVWSALQSGMLLELLQVQASFALVTPVASFMAAAIHALVSPAQACPPGHHLHLQHQKRLPLVLVHLYEPLSWALDLLEVMPVLMLSTPKIVDLLLASLEAYALIKRWRLLQRHLAAQASSKPGTPGSTTSSSNGSTDPSANAQVSDIFELITRLATIAGGAVVVGCANLMDPVAGPEMDSSHVTALLRLCCSCMCCMPCCLVLSSSTPELMLSAALLACYCSDSEQCRAAMDWCQCLCSQPFIAASHSEAGSPDAYWPAALCSYAQLVNWLESGPGPQLLQALLLAASISMPQYLITPLSAALHSVWRGIGTERFTRWTRQALTMPAPSSPPPWHDLAPEQISSFLSDLVANECVSNVPRFKRVIKSLCAGAKAKAEAGDLSAGAATPACPNAVAPAPSLPVGHGHVNLQPVLLVKSAGDFGCGSSELVAGMGLDKAISQSPIPGGAGTTLPGRFTGMMPMDWISKAKV